MASSSTKKKNHTVLSLEDKVNILKWHDEAKLALEYGVGKTTVSELNKKHKLRTSASSLESLSGNTKERKVMRMAQDD
jgi:hypothetical protein